MGILSLHTLRVRSKPSILAYTRRIEDTWCASSRSQNDESPDPSSRTTMQTSSTSSIVPRPNLCKLRSNSRTYQPQISYLKHLPLSEDDARRSSQNHVPKLRRHCKPSSHYWRHTSSSCANQRCSAKACWHLQSHKRPHLSTKLNFPRATYCVEEDRLQSQNANVNCSNWAPHNW